MKEEESFKTESGRWDWYGESKEESQDEPCYQGKFWDSTTKTFKNWNELIGTHNNEKEGNSNPDT